MPENFPEPVRLAYRGDGRSFSVMGDSIFHLLKDCRLSNRNDAGQYPQMIIQQVPAVYPADHMKRMAKLCPNRWDCYIADDLTLHVTTSDNTNRSTFSFKPQTFNNKIVAIWETKPGFYPSQTEETAPEPEIEPPTAPKPLDNRPGSAIINKERTNETKKHRSRILPRWIAVFG